MVLPTPSPSLQSRIEIEKGGLVRIMGPAKVDVAEGYMRILGVDIHKGSTIVISRYRSYCLKALEDSVLNVLLGEGGSIERPNPSEEVVDVWESIAKSIAEKGGTAVVLGGVESGKTSFSTLLSNIALDVGRKPCIIDADVGQGDLAPPTFIGMKCFNKKVLWLREERGDYMRFVGALTPSQPTAMAKIIIGVLELMSIARHVGGDLVVINTDGWFGDSSAMEYKYTLVKALSPTSVIVLDRDFCSVFKMMFRHTAIDIYCVPRPKVVKERSREDRRDLRKLNYQKWFSNMKRVCLNVDSIAISGVCSLNGATVPSEEVIELEKTIGVKVIYVSRYNDFDIVVVPDDVILNKETFERIGLSRRVFIVRPSNAKGLIAAITDRRLCESGVAIIDEIDFSSRRICLLTEYNGEIGGIMVGKVKLDEQWSDTVRHQKCLI